MSHHTCNHCGARFRDHHECDRDPEHMAAELGTLRAEVDELRAEVSTLRDELDALRARLPA